jgi:hypothetical protein
VKVTDGVFLVALSNVDADRTRNLQLLKERSWFDVPLIYANQRSATIAIEKGASGERAFKDALTAWGEDYPTDATETVASALRSWGLLGKWGTECYKLAKGDRPPKPNVTFAIEPDGKLIYENSGNIGDVTSAMPMLMAPSLWDCNFSDRVTIVERWSNDGLRKGWGRYPSYPHGLLDSTARPCGIGVRPNVGRRRRDSKPRCGSIRG